MKLKVFTLRFSGSTGGFDDQPLQEFIADKEVIEFSEHFFIHENKPCLTILIAYRALESIESRRFVRQADPRLELDGADKEAYDALRAWRAAAAKMEGIPPYMIDDETWRRSTASLVGHLRQARTRNLRAPFFERPGAYEAPTA